MITDDKKLIFGGVNFLVFFTWYDHLVMYNSYLTFNFLVTSAQMYIVERILTACELSNTDCKHSFHSLDKVGTAPKSTISDISYFASMLLAAARHDMGESTIIGPRQTTDY